MSTAAGPSSIIAGRSGGQVRVPRPDADPLLEQHLRQLDGGAAGRAERHQLAVQLIER